MAIRTTIKKDSVNIAKLKRDVGNVVSKSAREYKDRIRRSMIEQRPLGNLYEYKVRGAGFTRAHRASARGQRPQPETLTLSSAIQSKKTSALTATVDIAHRINPKNGEDAHDYAERLQNDMDRKVLNDSSDLRIAQLKFDFDLAKVAEQKR